MVAKGDTWEGHELLSELDRGMVRTFLARQVGDTKELVWLHLREDARLDGGVFAEEIARLQRLSDEVPEVVRVLYGGLSGSVAWAASPVQNDALRLKEATRRGPDLGLTALQMVIEIGEIIDRANKLRVVHGALSPQRVFIAANNGYALTHFGFPRLFQVPEEDAICEPFYTAPELIFGGRLSERTDVYGLGTVMYELICRRDLYADEEHRTLSTKTWEPRFPLVVPAGLRHVMQTALARDPSKRYRDVAQMLTVLRVLAKKWEDSGRPPASVPEGAAVPVPNRPPQQVAEWEPFAADDDELPEIGRSLDESEPPPPPRVSPERPANDSHPAEIGQAAPQVTGPPAPSPSPPPPTSSCLAGSGDTARSRRSPARWVAGVLALAFLLGSTAAVLRWEPPRRAATCMGLAVQAAALRTSRAPSARSLDRRPEPSAAAPPPVARPRTDHPTTRQAMTTLSHERDPFNPCDGLVPCQKDSF